MSAERASSQATRHSFAVATSQFARRAWLLLSITSVVTDVEPSSTASTSGGIRRRYLVATLAGAVITAATSVGIVAPLAPSFADSLATAKAQAAQIAAQVAADGQRLDVLSQQYEIAQAKVEQLNSQIAQNKSAIADDQAAVGADKANLRTQAVEAYITGGGDNGIVSLFSSGGTQAAAADEYRSVASGNVSNAVDALQVAQTHLSAQQDQLQTSEAQADAALSQVSGARQAAAATEAGEQAALGSADSEVSALVAQEQAAQAATAHAAYLARVAAEQAAAPAAHAPAAGAPAAGATFANVPASGAGGAAVAAAESQLGVPYVWGGETPGVGFDCSGLTQWSWGRAGVGIPRTAQDQYDAITHISLSALEPGDLLFWGDSGGIYHVAMYVGNGEVIQAPETGETVSYAPIWNTNLVGAGRP